MKKSLATFVLFLCVMLSMVTHAQAPIPLYNHPQAAFYASQADWPTDSAQCHWHPGSPESTFAHPAHTHFDETAPRYAKVKEGDSFVIPFSVKLFHTAGRITEIRTSALINHVVWDETGTSQIPVMIGDPHGLKTWTGHFTVAFTHLETLHGWWGTEAAVITLYDNGDRTQTKLMEPYFVNTDPTVPESWGRKTVGTRCETTSKQFPDIAWGVTLAEYDDYIPVLPIFNNWSARFSSAGYGSRGLGAVTFEQRVDLDLHNDIPGILLARIDSQGDIATVVNFDPAVLGSGPHKMAVLRNQPHDTGEQVTALLVTNVIVGAGVPPPQLCTDPLATNFGGPLPCAYPPPPPPPVEEWRSVVPLFEEQFIGGVAQGKFRFCVAPNRCFVIG